MRPEIRSFHHVEKQLNRISKQKKQGNMIEDDPDKDPLEEYKSRIEYNRDQINSIKKEQVQK